MKLKRRSTKKRITRIGLLVSNVIILLAIISFVVQKPTSASSTSTLSSSSTASSLVGNPLDQVASANIALTVAQMNNLPETTAISNQAQTQAAEIAQASTTDNVVSKPQVNQTSLKSRSNITSYTAVSGDTVASIALHFGVTSESIMWSNGLNSGIVTAGQNLVIPPVNGIVYTVKAGDSPQTLASKYSADLNQIIAYNDAEIKGINPGERIIIPDGTVHNIPSIAVSGSASGNSGLLSGWAGPTYGSNGYDYGYCTWYVASRLGVPSNWGNASSWSYYAGVSGWNVSSSPVVGSIAQTPNAAGGQGHVAIVEAISPDGTQIKYSDMNNYGDGGGWGRVGYSNWAPISSFPHYISH
jgi:surface antigen